MGSVGRRAQRGTEHDDERRTDQGNFAAVTVADEADEDLSDNITCGQRSTYSVRHK